MPNEEDRMAKQIPPFTIDRRQLLVSGVAVTAIGIIPADVRAEAANTIGLAAATISESEPPAWNVCAAGSSH
jgi:hypothetical protein